MHAQDGAAHHHAAQGPAGAGEGQREACRRNGNGDHDGHDGEDRIEGQGQRRKISQHRHEMRGPDAGTRHHACPDQPGQAQPHGLQRMGPQHHDAGGNAGQQAQAHGGDEQPRIVLVDKAAKDSIHACH